jgi:hypothetical protein
LIDFDLAAIDLFLTPDTEGGPWHGGHALWQNIFLAVDAYPVCAIRNPEKSAPNLPKRVRIPVKISNREFAFFHQLHLIESVRRLVDDDFVAVAQ